MVRAVAGFDHWRWVLAPRCRRTSAKVTLLDQRRTNQRRMSTGSASRSVHRNAWGGAHLRHREPARSGSARAGQDGATKLCRRRSRPSVRHVHTIRSLGGGASVSWTGEAFSQVGLPFSDDTWPPDGAGAVPGRRIEQARMQTQASDHAHAPAHRIQQVDGGVAPVGHRNDLPARQPSRRLQQTLSAPVGQLLVPPLAFAGIAF